MDRVEKINYVYDELRKRGIVHTKKEFARDIGYNYNNLINSMNGKTEDYLTDDFFKNIIVKYPFLADGLGILISDYGSNKKKPMYVQKIHNPPYREAMSNDEILLYDIDAAANLKTLLSDKKQNIIGRLSIPNIPKCDGALFIRGDSMYPLLKSGDIVAYKELKDFNYIVYGEMYLVDFVIDDDDYLVVKYVQRSDEEGKIKLVSYNPNHPPMDIPIRDCIRAMAIVKASIRFNTMI